jgi:hypothetical protein
MDGKEYLLVHVLQLAIGVAYEMEDHCEEDVDEFRLSSTLLHNRTNVAPRV